MNKLNNRGQSLALFIVFIPVIIMVGTLVVDISYAKYNNRKINSIAKEVLDYGLTNIDSNPYNDMIDLIYKNDENIDEYKIDIKVDEKQIDISLSKTIKGFFGSIVGKEIYIEKCSYTGYFKEQEKIIEKKVN